MDSIDNLINELEGHGLIIPGSQELAHRTIEEYLTWETLGELHRRLVSTYRDGQQIVDRPNPEQWLLHQVWSAGFASTHPLGIPEKVREVGPIPWSWHQRRRRARLRERSVGMSGLLLGPHLGEEQVKAVIAEIKQRAAEAGAKFALVGGVAMQLYGSARNTKDVDFIANKEIPGGQGLLTFGGYQLKAAGHSVDWILRNDDYQQLYQEALEFAVPSALGIPMISQEYMAAMKLAAGRPKDLEDLVFLLRFGKVDLKKARKIVRQRVGGQFGLESFEQFVLEAEWRNQQESQGTPVTE